MGPSQIDHTVRGATQDSLRVRADGKFLYRGPEKLYIRGFTYGTFAPDAGGQEFHDRVQVERDFAMMADQGANAVRTYTVPPRWLLDAAAGHGLMVMVGIPWEQHVAFLEDRARVRSIVDRVRAAVRTCAGHPAVLCFAVGNEIPAPIVRWHGRRRIERFIERLYRAAKAEDPEALVTYVNFPSTEYLELPFLDLACFNVYLEAREDLERYLARLQNLAGDRPLVMAEVGLDSRRNGEEGQAQTLEWQLRCAYESGCGGAFVFAWTDEWHRGGAEIEDWDFGVTDRRRRPKLALDVVRQAFREIPFAPRRRWPRVSVVVCTHNGNGTLKRCMEGLSALRYPDFEVIFVDDGSTDPSAVLRARDYGFTLIQTENRGLSSARNTGWQAATGEIIAYLDDDAWPDPDWLTYLAVAFEDGGYGGVGGPNIPPPSDGRIAQCVANAPGGPIHVLLSDTEAEHIPGCNMAFRRDALAEVGGFDPQFRVAGDDVDLCWRVQEAGYRLGFSPAAMVWHHRRNSVRAYWRQQRGYGKAEALLERKWPERYNAAGHVRWAGRLYGRGVTLPLSRRQRVHHGRWGLGLFQSLYEPAPGTLSALPLMPEWYLVIAALALIGGLGAVWRPLLLVVPLLVAAVLTALIQAVKSTRAGTLSVQPHESNPRQTAMRALTMLLYLIQPAARLRGRLGHGLSPWRHRRRALAWPIPHELEAWHETWRAPEERVQILDRALVEEGAWVRRGDAFARWDLEVSCGALGKMRGRLAVEEHGQGKQLIRMRLWPRWPHLGFGTAVILGGSSAAAFLDGAPVTGVALAVFCAVITIRVAIDLAAAAGAFARAFRDAADLGTEVPMVTASERPGRSARPEAEVALTGG